MVSDRAHLLFDLHKEVDGAREAELAVRGLFEFHGSLVSHSFANRVT